MSSPSLENLSREELIALLKQKEQEVSALKREKAIKEGVVAEMRHIINQANIDCRTCGLADTLSDEQLLKALEIMARHAARGLCNSRLIATHYARGDEANITTAPDKKVLHQAKNLSAKLASTKRQMQRLAQGIDQLGAQYQGDDPSMQAVGAIFNSRCISEVIERQTDEDDWSIVKGRQPSKAKLTVRTLVNEEAAPRCPTCDTPMLSIGSQVQTCKNIIEELGQLVEEVNSQVNLFVCPVCSEVKAVYPEQSPRAVIPNQSLSQEVIVEMQNLLVNGIPANRAETIFLEPMALGSDTYSRTRLDWARYYARPLVNAIIAGCADNDVLICDETTYDCLQSQGRGVSQAPEQTSSQSYVLALSNPMSADKRMATYRYMNSRRADSIGDEIQALALNPKVLVTDGYGAYPSLLKKRWPQMKQQSCLIHFRREVIEALNLPDLAKQTKVLDEKELRKLKQKWFEDSSPALKMLAVVDALASIYHEQEKIDPCDLTAVEQLRRDRIAPLMRHIDTIMLSMVEEYTEQSKGRYSKKNGSPYCKPVVYYMNLRDQLRYFLNDARVPCDTNLIERSIRPLTLIRKNNNFMQSIEGLKATCDTFTLFETARINGISNPVQWLLDYGQALHDYCFDRAWTEAYREGKSGDKKIMRWDMKKLAEGFNYDPWLPWNWHRAN